MTTEADGLALRLVKNAEARVKTRANDEPTIVIPDLIRDPEWLDVEDERDGFSNPRP